MSEENLNITIECLRHSIEDTQATIRAYDTKAEILAALLTLIIGVTNFKFFDLATGLSKGFLISSWITAVIAIFCLGLVLYPNKYIFKNIKLGTYTPTKVYYLCDLEENNGNTVSALADRALSTNWTRELMYENMKLSLIRDKKHLWFVHSLRISGLTFALILIGRLLGA